MTTFTVSDPLTLRVLAFIAERAQPAWMVGGFVRDRLLNRPDHDLDLVVPAGGIELARAVARAFGGAFFVLDEERDVARALLQAEAGGAPLTVDVARLRAPELWQDLALRDFTVNAMAAPVSPLAGSEPLAWELVDPLDGFADLQRRALRAVSSDAFRDDPLRTLRGVRLAVELGFHLETATVGLIRRDAGLLARVAAERIRDELLRIVNAPGAWQHLRLLAGLDLLRPVLPEVQALAGVMQSEPHYLDAFDHTRAVMAHAEGILALLWPEGPWTAPADLAAATQAPPSAERAADLAAAEVDPPSDGPVAAPNAVESLVMAPEWQWAALAETLAPFREALQQHLSQPLASGRTRCDWFLWAALAHDWGKAVTRTVGSDWRIHFYDHEHQGAVLAEERLHLLACAAHESAYVGLLVDEHMRPAHLARHYPPSRRALYRFFHAAGQSGPDVTLLSLADKMATRAPLAEADAAFWQDLLGVARQVFEAYFEAHAERVNPAPLLDGRAVMAELALSPGPQVGRLLDGLREAQAIGEVTTVEEARAWLHHAAGDGRES